MNDTEKDARIGELARALEEALFYWQLYADDSDGDRGYWGKSLEGDSDEEAVLYRECRAALCPEKSERTHKTLDLETDEVTEEAR